MERLWQNRYATTLELTKDINPLHRGVLQHAEAAFHTEPLLAHGACENTETV